MIWVSRVKSTYMKMHLGSMLNNKPKLGFGRTDLDESLWANIHKKRQRIKQGSGERMRKKGEKEHLKLNR